MITGDSLPFSVKLSLNLLTIVLLALILYLGQSIFVPIFFFFLLATLLLPVTNYLQRLKMPKILAIMVTIFIALGIVAAMIYFLSVQISIFLDDIDTIKTRIGNLLSQVQNWVHDTFNISRGKQREYLEDTAQNIKDTGPGFLGRTLGTITEGLSYLVFLPVYTFLLLFYKDLIKNFFISVFTNANPDKVGDVLYQARTIGRDYVLGLFIDMTIVFTLNSVGFLIVGIKYPIFLAIVAAILNLIPYIGMLIANVFTVLITIVSTDDPTNALWAAVVLAAVQFIDNNFLMPLIVGNKVRINALVTIIGVVIGGTLCGIGGMFLAIPAIACLKVIFDNVPDLKPWGMLLGDDVQSQKKKETNPII